MVSDKASGISLLLAPFLQLWRPLPKYNKALLVLLWLTAWFSSTSLVQQIVMPLLILAEMPLLGNLGSQSAKSGFLSWLKTIPTGPRKQQRFEYLSGLLFTLLLLLPVMTTSSSNALMLVPLQLLYMRAGSTFRIAEQEQPPLHFLCINILLCLFKWADQPIAINRQQFSSRLVLLRNGTDFTSP